MTVKIINTVDKFFIAHQYSSVKVKVKDLAIEFNVSPRTIQRVLVEMKANKVRKPKQVAEQTIVATQSNQPKKSGIVSSVKGFFASFFRSKQHSNDAQANT
jgi:23S rRNA G2445 N2-methylase RlmL